MRNGERGIKGQRSNSSATQLFRPRSDAGFRTDLEAAKKEYANLRAKGSKPSRDCQAESDALAFTGEVEIQESWQGDYPVARLDLLQ